MANVLLRSPYYISQDIGTDLSAKIEITIDSVLAYTIVKNKPSNSTFVLFEIAELVRDYIDIKYNGSITPSDLNVNVSYVLNKYPQANAGGNAVNLGTTTFFGIDGYGYFEEGSNPSVTQGYMQSNDIIYTLNGEDIRIPVDKNHTTSVSYFNKGSQVFTEPITSSLTDVFHYTDAIDSFKERVVEDSGTYEESSCIDSFIDSNSLYSVDEIRLETEGTELITNGNFATDTDWIKTGEATIISNNANFIGSVSEDASVKQFNIFEEGKEYIITLDAVVTSGLGIKVQDTLTDESIGVITTTGSYTFIFSASSSSTFYIGRRNNSQAFNCSVSNVSVKQYSIKKVKVITLDECKYEPIKLTFVNRFGALQDLWFFKKSIEKVNTKKETFNRFTINSDTGVYDTSIHQNQTFNVNSNKKLTINTGYVDESYNSLMQELMQSEQIWLELNSVVTPINLDTNSLTFKTSVNDKLVDYTVEVSYSFDAINNIR
tara:strand:+ start:5669 stop:7132 length:1464 start_codon:yes stop_codon:yes gene_type:complete